MKTTQTAHTPGPWATDNSGEISDSHAGIAQVYFPGAFGSSQVKAECMANARLIAAAPETARERDELKELNAELLAACRLALKNAEGRLHRMPASPATRDEETARIAQECECGILRAAIAK